MFVNLQIVIYINRRVRRISQCSIERKRKGEKEISSKKLAYKNWQV